MVAGGPRWVVQLQLGAPAGDLGDAYAATLHQWWSESKDPQPLDTVFEVLPHAHRRITQQVIDHPAAEFGHAELELLKAALLDYLARERALSGLAWGPAVLNAVALELYLQPHPQLAQLRETVAAACRSVFTPRPAVKPSRAHSAIAYRNGSSGDGRPIQISKHVLDAVGEGPNLESDACPAGEIGKTVGSTTVLSSQRQDRFTD